jgi:IclR family KDG regulon transcriptional repressor
VPLHCTGVGKIFLAFSSPEDIETYIESTGLPAYTAHSMSNPYVLRKHLAEVRTQGFAVDNEERELGTRCIAAPIWDSEGNVLAALSVSGPATRLPEERWDTVASQVKHAATTISSNMGFADVNP